MHAHSHVESSKTESKKPHAFFPYLIGSTLGAISENLLFHWLDTISKRLQKHPQRPSIYSPNFTHEIKQIILPNVTGFHDSITSLYQGLRTGIAYRIIQRNVMFAGQPWANRKLNQYAGPMVGQYFGDTYRNPVIAAMAGFLTCLMEMPFLLLDTAKVRMQTQNIFFSQAIAQGNLYHGSSITLARNMIAATTMFGCAAYIRQLYGADNPQQASLKQEWIAASISATFATSLNNWADMLKTRMQASNGTLTSKQIAKQIWENEGAKGFFFRGMIPRLITVAPRTAFTMTFVNQTVKKVNEIYEQGFFSRKKTNPESVQSQLKSNEENIKSMGLGKNNE